MASRNPVSRQSKANCVRSEKRKNRANFGDFEILVRECLADGMTWRATSPATWCLGCGIAANVLVFPSLPSRQHLPTALVINSLHPLFC